MAETRMKIPGTRLLGGRGEVVPASPQCELFRARGLRPQLYSGISRTKNPVPNETAARSTNEWVLCARSPAEFL